MDTVAAFFRRLPVGWFVVPIILAVAGTLVYFFWAEQPLRGSVAVSITAIDAEPRVAALDLPNLTESALTFTTTPEVRRGVLAAVPSYDRTHTAYLTWNKEEGRQVFLADAAGATQVGAVAGVVEAPAWSWDATSVAFAMLTTASTTLNTANPDVWTVVRAVGSDTLVVGHGYRPYPTSGQKTLALISGGIALLSYADAEPELVVASPIPTPITTVFTASTDGRRVAWINPADQSLQVFENVNDFFVPLLLRPGHPFQSMVFSPDGQYLLGARSTEATSTIALIDIAANEEEAVGEVAGIVQLHTWTYDK